VDGIQNPAGVCHSLRLHTDVAGTGEQTYRLVGYTAAVAISRVGLLLAFPLHAADKRDV
jgi:hypothetical protein